MPDRPETARDRLREATAEAHAKVEATLGVGAPNVTRQQYHRALTALLGVYNTAAAWLPSTNLARLAAAPYERLSVHVAHLRADLQHVQALPGRELGCAPPPTGWGDAHGFGILYVIEGSTLGGQYVASNIARCFGIDAADGLAFFRGDGAGTGKRWRAFRADLAKHINTAQAIEQAIAGAQWTFDALLAAWERAGDP